MNITFYGAARTVTGSKHLITTSKGRKLLLDCGLFQGKGSDTEELNRHFGFEPSEIDYMILSHAHTDHAGLIPRLVKEGYTGPILGGGIYMFLFGLGTLPMMFILSMSGSFVSQKVRTVINKFSPVIAIGLALFLINRGATLRSEKADCCHKQNHITVMK
jgi:Cft2 family RNA processing exonuclease